MYYWYLSWRTRTERDFVWLHRACLYQDHTSASKNGTEDISTELDNAQVDGWGRDGGSSTLVRFVGAASGSRGNTSGTILASLVDEISTAARRLLRLLRGSSAVEVTGVGSIALGRLVLVVLVESERKLL